MTTALGANQARIRSLDFLRGLAILGMLVANIPWHAGDSMSRVIDPDAASVTAWIAQYLVFDQRFLPIFCMLFGAGALLLASRPSAPQRFVPYFLIRMAILLSVGVAHAYLLWPGDILITYAVCSPFLLLALNWSVVRLLTAGVLLKSISLVIGEWPQLYEATLERALFSWWVDYGDAPSTIGEAYAGGYAELFRYNAWRNQFIQWTALPYFRVWNALGFMLIGMALYKTGVLQGARSAGFYRRLLTFSLVLGLPLVIYGVVARVGVNPSVGPYLGFEKELPLRSVTFLLGCAITCFAVLAGAHLFYKRFAGRVTEPVERVGRMALTNYLLHSVTFLLLFHWLKVLPFDAFDHDVLILLVVAAWLLQIALSWLWLARFRQGPVEALWRWLTAVFTRSLRDTSRRVPAQ
ncbi:MAG: DUF418 domain-containing protein [Pseudomonadota bacterium]